LEKEVVIQSKGAELEGLLAKSSCGQRGVVVAHPHPLYGGDMFNNVVETVTGAWFKMGYTTLRFNFRGVGQSSGAYDDGKGEQDDVAAAVKFIANTGVSYVDLAGYSFGSWVNALCLKRLFQAQRMIMISPPVGLLDFSTLGRTDRVGLVITGSSDQIAKSSMIQKILPKWNPTAEFRIIQGADHFYQTRTSELSTVIRKFLSSNQE
jgi:alpha/beta superfamily hydrolase